MSRNTCGRGKYKVWLKKTKIGDDLVYFVGGGDKSHVGGMTVCEPGKKRKDVHLIGHYDYVITRPIAEAACKKYKKKVLCVGGVHIDNATKEEIGILVENCTKLVGFV